MELYKRVRKIAQEIAGSDVKMGTALGMNPRTFSGYLKDTREHNLWPLLPKILEIYPQISREWLYFGEGEMLISQRGGQAAAKPMVAAMTTGASSEREASLERENALLRELLASKDKIIALHERAVMGLTTPTNTEPVAAPSVPTSPSARPSVTAGYSKE